jgi:hypothetical protein
MPCAVIQSKSSNELCVGGCTMLHGHDLNHVKIWFCRRLVDGKDGIDDVGSQLFSERAIDLG